VISSKKRNIAPQSRQSKSIKGHLSLPKKWVETTKVQSKKLNAAQK
jgi:hypothetical protein